MSDYPTDRRGYVHIVNGEGEAAQVLPESAPVWLEDGWNLKETDNRATVNADQPNDTGHVPHDGEG